MVVMLCSDGALFAWGGAVESPGGLPLRVSGSVE